MVAAAPPQWDAKYYSQYTKKERKIEEHKLIIRIKHKTSKNIVTQYGKHQTYIFCQKHV